MRRGLVTLQRSSDHAIHPGHALNQRPQHGPLLMPDIRQLVVIGRPERGLAMANEGRWRP